MVSYRFGDFVFDADVFALSRAGVTLPLQPQVLDVLRYLIERRGHMVSKAELLDQLWRGHDVNEGVLSWSVSHIRRALGQQRSDKQPIETVHGRGYRFTAPVSVVARAAAEPVAAPAPLRAEILVGRERALGELQAYVQAAVSGRGGLCVVTGEAGIGKTRCVDTLVERVAAVGIRTIAGRCPEAPGVPPLWPIASALAQLDDEIGAQARRLIAGIGDQSRLPSPGEGARFRTLEGVARLLRELAVARPLLLVLDDLHWADSATLQLLGLIATELAELPLCIVATLRDSAREPGGMRERALLQLLRHARTLPLGSLTRDQIAELMAALLGREPSVELAEAIRRASGGVPLFVHEVLRSLSREYGEDALDRLRPEAVRVPALARDLLRERMQQLPAPTLELLAGAAAIGDDFELSLLCALLALKPEALLDRLAPAIVAGVLASEVPHAYRFAHAMFRAVLYDSMLPGQRVAFHRKIGQLLEGRVDAEARKGEIARHYYYSLAAGEPELVTERARAAGAAAVRVFAFDEAVLYFGWALEAQVFAGVAEPRARGELLLALASAQRSAGRTGDATDTAARVIELAQQHRLYDLIVGATRQRRPTVALATVPDSLTRSALELLLRQLPADADAVRISAMAQLACVPPYEHDLARSKELSANAVALAERRGDRELLFEALRARLFALSGPDDVDAALQVAERMLALERAGERTWQSMDARVARFAALLLAGRIAAADVALDEMDAAMRTPHWGEAKFYCERMRAQRRFLDGHFDEAEQSWKAVFSQGARAGVAYAETLRAVQALHLEFEREGAARAFDRHLRASSNGMRRLPRALRADVVRIAALAGEHELVRAELAALGDPGDYPRNGTYLHTLACLAVCAVAIGHKTRCEQLFALLSPYAERNTPDAMGYYLGSVSHFLGLLSVALGRLEAARGFFQRALQHNRALGYRAGAVHTLLARAELEQRFGQSGRARAAWQAAHGEAQALGMRSALALADAALARLA